MVVSSGHGRDREGCDYVRALWEVKEDGQRNNFCL